MMTYTQRTCQIPIFILIHLYTGEGKQRKDELSLQEGNNDEYKIAEEFSINKLMTLQRDFLDEVTLLKYYAQQMGVCVDFTPKCHPELAGEGIEYDWAISKLNYCQAPISEKRSKDKFKEVVRA